MQRRRGGLLESGVGSAAATAMAPSGGIGDRRNRAERRAPGREGGDEDGSASRPKCFKWLVRRVGPTRHGHTKKSCVFFWLKHMDVG
jgi:hypothetical protein